MSDELFIPSTVESEASTDFQAWCRQTANFMPTPKQAWDAQLSYINKLEQDVMKAAKVIKSSRKLIEDLKNMFEENLMVISKLETENLQLKGELPKDL